MDLLSFSHVRSAGRVIAIGGRVELRLAVSITMLMRGGRASLATDPEEPDAFDLELGAFSGGAPVDGAIACTSSRSPWRFAVGNVPRDVDPARPLLVSPADWSRAMIEVTRDGRAEWLAPPRIVPHAFLAEGRSADPLQLVLARVDLDSTRARLRAMFRAERALQPRDMLARVAFLTTPGEEQLSPAELSRRTGGLSPEAAVFRAVAQSSEASVAPAPLAPVDATPDRLTLGQRLAHQTTPTSHAGRALEEPVVDEPTQVPRAAPRVLWAAPDIARRVRRSATLRELWPRARRDEEADDPETIVRTRKHVGQLLRDAPMVELSSLAADPHPAFTDEPVAVSGWLALDLDDVAALRATVAAIAVWRKSHPALEEAAAHAEVLLGSGGLEDLPGLARDATTRIEESLRAARAETADTVRAAVSAGLVRARHVAKRRFDAETWVRARISEQDEAQSVVTYLPHDCAERLPLLRRVAVLLLADVSPPMEEADRGPALFALAIGRDARG